MSTTILETLVALGHAAFQRGDLAEADTLFRRAHAGGRADAELLHFLGYIARARDDLADAGNFYAAALARAPTDAQLHNNLAEVRRAQHRDAEALALYRRAAALAPDQAEIHGNLGSLLMALRRPDEALPHLLKALDLRPDLLALRNEAALALSALGRYPETIAQYRAVVAAEPANAGARYLEALALLATGDFERGWRRHEARWYAELGETRRRVFEQPSWLGEDNLAAQTILLHAEQGYGDTLWLARYVARVAAMAGQVMLEVHPALKPLLTGLPGATAVFARGEALPPFDQHCSFMSLPLAFRTTLATVPATVPYLAPPPDRVSLWRERLGPADGRRRIAFAWSGSLGGPWNRDMPLSALLPLLRRADCAWHVAQVDVTDEERTLLAGLPGVTDHSTALRDFADTAALLAETDLTIGVDTALVHLAGALARPVWTLLPLGADYRWLMQRDDSPWYPTMRLFRQPRLHDWPAVAAAAGAALDALPA